MKKKSNPNGKSEMKNLLVYFNPLKDFDEETKILAKIQIDNLLDLGWKIEDILLVTNFPYEYNGVKALVVTNEISYLLGSTQNKIVGILLLFEQGLINNHELYWCHDFDQYQLQPITEAELELGTADLGLTDYGRNPQWHMDSIFFKDSSRDIFDSIKETVLKHQLLNEEHALQMLTANDDSEITKRIKKLNITYNLWRGNIVSCYEMADKPIRAVHFHPTRDMLDFFMYGKNKVNMVLLPERLIEIFNHHGIK